MKKLEEARKKKEEEEKEPPEFKRKAGSKGELRISPYAWAKLIWLRDRGSTEISVFGLSRLTDLLYVEDVALVEQDASLASFEFDDDKLNEYLFDMVKQGYQPVECMRIWIHTHPGGASPSGVDHATFDKTAGEADWGIMCIVGKDDETSARLRTSGAGRKYDYKLEVVIDWTGPFRGVSPEDAEEWEKEYQAKVKKETTVIVSGGGCYSHGYHDYRSYHQETQGDSDPSYRTQQYYGENADWRYGDGWRDDGDKDMPRMQPTMGDRMTPTMVPANQNPPENHTFGPQMIHKIDDDIEDGVTTVWTDKYWFEYDINDDLQASANHEVDTMLDISNTLPLSWGEALWSIDDDGNPIYEKMSIYDEANDGFFGLDTEGKKPLVEEPKEQEEKEEPVGEEAKEEPSSGP